jgi:uncharacterized protein (DUF2384 family)
VSPELAPPTIADAPATPSLRSPARKMFTRRSARVAMPVEAATRQGRIAMLAWEALGDGEAVRTFLNTHDAELDARPIDLATASAAGLETVAALIATRKGATA